MTMENCKVTLRPREEDRIRNGHPWVYNNEVAKIEGTIVSGEIVRVVSSKGEFLGKGFLNTASKIFVRIVTRDDIAVDAAFFRERLATADVARRSLGFASCYRICFAEADGIPGFVVDRYGDVLVVQILSLYVELHKSMFVQMLVDLFAPTGIYERSDVSVRIKEGLEESVGVLYGNVPDVVRVDEKGILMDVDVRNGQKTGAFLDQQENHAAVAAYAKGADVLDCFSHTGGFGLHAARAGASSVTCVDISASACERIRSNAALNGLPNLTVVKADVFTLLRQQRAEGTLHDLVILDPPAFAKTSENLEHAYAGYKEINIQGMGLVRSGGFLVSCSCSQHMTPALFLQMLMEAAADAGRIAQMVEFRTQGRDHPTLLGSEETFYLKVVVLRILDREGRNSA
jgi:23S rRNA (cytosine1962-C5)-methyltransferase